MAHQSFFQPDKKPSILRAAKLIILGSLFLLPSVSAFAQRLGGKPLIGFLSSSTPGAMSARVEAFQQGLREIGYSDRENLAVDYRYSEGNRERLKQLAGDMVARKVSVIVTHGDAALAVLKQVNKTIPVVVGVTGDLVETGYAASLARPGGNVTGFVDVSPDLSGKRLEILKEVLPKLSRITVLWNSGNRVKLLDFKESEKAAAVLGLTLQSLEVTKPGDFPSRLSAALVPRTGALVVLADSLTLANTKAIIEFATKNKFPAMFGFGEVIDGGGLMSYAANVPDLFRQAAGYVDKILKGANVANLPIQQPTKFEFLVNLNAAKQIGLAIPPNVLVRADRVIR
jgi:putative ABC transport system substrate-binding protein